MRALILCACVGLLAAAETPPSPRDTDEVTRRRAEEALAAHAAANDAPSKADLPLLDRFSAVEAMVQEGEGFLAKQLASQAGERYVAAAEKLKGFTAEERQVLGKRWAALQESFTALGRKLAESEALEKAAADAAEPAEAPAQGEAPAKE